MNSQNIILRSIQGVSFVAILIVLSLGFVMPISVTQGFIISPLLFLLFVSSFAFAGSKIENVQNSAKLHQLPIAKPEIQIPCCKAA